MVNMRHGRAGEQIGLKGITMLKRDGIAKKSLTFNLGWVKRRS